MSRDILLTDHIKSLFSSSNSYTGTRLIDLRDRILDVLEQINDELQAQRNRITTLENSLKNIPDVVNFIQKSRFFVDADGDIAQNDTEEETIENG